RIAASGRRIVACPERLVHYTRGVGISSRADHFMRASLYNAQKIGIVLGMPPREVRRKCADIHFDFGRQALYERNMPHGGRLLRRSLDRASPRRGLYFAASFLPSRLLDARRTATRAIANSAPRVPAEATQRVAPARAERSQPLLVVTIDAEEEFDWD